MPAADERQLITEARNGSHEAYRVLIERHMRAAYNVAFGFVGDHETAEDVTQESFVRAYKSLKGFRGDSEFATWLYRIVTNVSLTRLKQRQRRSQYEIRQEEAVASQPSGEQDVAENMNARMHIERALHELPTMQRAVVILRHMDGLSTNQVSSILHCSEGTVKTHLHRGLKKLKTSLAFLQEEMG